MGREKTSVPNKQHDDEFPEFSFGLRCLGVGVEEAGNLEIIRSADQKKKKSQQRSRKGTVYQDRKHMALH